MRSSSLTAASGQSPGTYQEFKVVDERYLARKPSRLSFVEAAAAPLVTITAWEAIRERARVSEDQASGNPVAR
jgi:NADPH2:quinone reductase